MKRFKKKPNKNNKKKKKRKQERKIRNKPTTIHKRSS